MKKPERKKPNRERRKEIHLTLLDEEMKLLEEKAESFGMTRSDYLRSLIVWGSVKEKSKLTDEQFQSLLNEMNHIGVNINQIARRVNEARNASKEDFDQLEFNYERLLDLYRKWAQL